MRRFATCHAEPGASRPAESCSPILRISRSFGPHKYVCPREFRDLRNLGKHESAVTGGRDRIAPVSCRRRAASERRCVARRFQPRRVVCQPLRDAMASYGASRLRMRRKLTTNCSYLPCYRGGFRLRRALPLLPCSGLLVRCPARPLGGMADAGDLKSLAGNGIPVRVREGLLQESCWSRCASSTKWKRRPKTCTMTCTKEGISVRESLPRPAEQHALWG